MFFFFHVKAYLQSLVFELHLWQKKMKTKQKSLENSCYGKLLLADLFSQTKHLLNPNMDPEEVFKAAFLIFRHSIIFFTLN